MKIDSIKRGIVLDHIKAGRSMDIYKLLHLDELECSVAIIKNVKSNAMGRKDIIKIDEEITIDLNVLGYIDPGITVNVIEDGVIVEKKHLELPERLTNVIRCKNPRCITSVEPGLDQIFRLADKSRQIYRCIYCDSERKAK
ncbi:MAG: aspartate carbamoyltransferase regulatory subunit [Clostridia bacterium]|nr:aspartate carbamoyltransferase regulatory subunit [Clostridia bacterium]MBQ7845855.1 aspartate carbamoyltransferase regulatory subunit [Clostridia bacterium]MBQ7866195.1 aspartate carbamoyltransferase regulatory subunit [Clostridia bacterium]